MYVAIAEPPTVRSMTTEELNEQKVLFGTYENRSQINCAEEAIAVRESLKAGLIAQGYTEQEIDELYPSS